MRGNPESLLISREERAERQGMLSSPERRNLNKAMKAFVAAYGPGDAAAWACVQATAYTLLANPKSTREARLAAADALFDAGGGV